MSSGKRGEVCALRRPPGTRAGADGVVVAVVATTVAAMIAAVAIERAGGGGIRASRRRVHNEVTVTASIVISWQVRRCCVIRL